MIGFSRSTFASSPRKSIGPTSGIIADLGGDSVGDIKTVNTITITNNKAIAIGFEIEQESNKAPVSATIQPGATVMLAITPIVTYWNANRRIHGWDGLNIQFREPV